MTDAQWIRHARRWLRRVRRLLRVLPLLLLVACAHGETAGLALDATNGLLSIPWEAIP